MKDFIATNISGTFVLRKIECKYGFFGQIIGRFLEHWHARKLVFSFISQVKVLPCSWNYKKKVKKISVDVTMAPSHYYFLGLQST